ncbi:MAG: DUF5658 family protein [Patescibacteria group bacterium]
MGKPILLSVKPNIWLLSVLAVAVIGLNVFDALATLAWLNIGMEKANPFLAYVLEYDTGLFIVVKTLGITAAVAFLTWFAVRRYAVALYGLALLAVAYLIPLAIHLFIYTHTSLY